MKTSAQNMQRKTESLDILRESYKKAAITIITDYRGPGAGLTVKEITELRNKLRENKAEYRVAKNTLINKVLEEAGVEGAGEHLNGPTAVAFGYDDPAATAKTVIEFSKAQKPNKLPIIKVAVMEGRVLTDSELKRIAELPTLDVLRMQLLGLMLATHRNVLGVVNATGRGMATVLDAWTKKEQVEA